MVNVVSHKNNQTSSQGLEPPQPKWTPKRSASVPVKLMVVICPFRNQARTSEARGIDYPIQQMSRSCRVTLVGGSVSLWSDSELTSVQSLLEFARNWN